MKDFKIKHKEDLIANLTEALNRDKNEVILVIHRAGDWCVYEEKSIKEKDRERIKESFCHLVFCSERLEQNNISLKAFIDYFEHTIRTELSKKLREMEVHLNINPDKVNLC